MTCAAPSSIPAFTYAMTPSTRKERDGIDDIRDERPVVGIARQAARELVYAQ